MSSTCPARVQHVSTNKNEENEEKKKEDSLEPPEAGNSKPPAVMVFPCVGIGPHEWPLTQSKVAEYLQTFPAVDILSECRKALQWCRDNPRKQKTARGLPAFLGRWLAKEQDKCRLAIGPNSGQPKEPVYGN